MTQKNSQGTICDEQRYDAIVIGFGKGGKTLAAALGAAGRRTALIERSEKMYGGTCINVGCIPTKFLVHKAQEARHIQDFEVKKMRYAHAVEEKEALTGRLRGKNLQKLEDMPQVTVITGTARFVSPHEIEVCGADGVQRLEGAQIFVNTGAVPRIPKIAGLEKLQSLADTGTAAHAPVYTSEELLSCKTLPEHLIIIGGGYIGVEFASIYADFGSRVTILQDGGQFLPREDAEIAAAVRDNLKSRRAEVMTDVQILSVEESNGRAVVTVRCDRETLRLEADAVLVAAGRQPNTEGLGLELAGVAVNERGGIVTDEHLRTTAEHIYAMGDVTGGLQFTYISLDDFRIVRSAVLGDGAYTTRKRGAVPYSVFLNPPFSRVGMSEQEARDRGYDVKVARLAAGAIPKAQVLEQTSGLLKAVIDAKTRQILGAHLFCEESHEMINLVKLAMDAGLPYTTLRDMIFTHPTMSEALNDLFQIS